MQRNIVVSTVVIVLAIVAAVTVTVMARPQAPEATRDRAQTPASTAKGEVVRSDSRRLSSAPQGSPVFVEFLDFECEACRAAYPLVEKLRRDYEGRVEFVIRYFPIESHANAMNAAVAVEAAARQGKLEQMYVRMYETQTQWSEQTDSKATVFRQFASDLKLDLKAFDADVASAEVKARVEKDRNDGTALGVEGTPTFFLDGKMIQPTSEAGLRQLLDDAIKR